MKSAKEVAIVLWLLIFASCSSEPTRDLAGIPPDLSRWLSLPPPKHERLLPKKGPPYNYKDPGVAWYAANHSKHSWEVYLKDGKPHAKRFQHGETYGQQQPPFEIPPDEAHPRKGRQTSLMVDDGWLIGLDAGEWGGSLWWYSPDGKEKYRISNDRIRQFMRMGDGIFALEGIAHLRRSHGKIISIAKSEDTDRWASALFANLPQAPYAAYLYRDKSFIVVTSSSLIRVSAWDKVETLMKDTFWRGLNPNSIVIDQNNYVFIGMRQGVAKFRLGVQPGSIQWLVPNRGILEEDLQGLNEMKRRLTRHRKDAERSAEY